MAKKLYWCGNCHLEFHGEPAVQWLKDAYEYYNFCSKKCSEEFKTKMENGHTYY